MEVPVIGFIPPIVGIDGEFNTFRLGIAFCKKIKPGDEVFLMDEKKRAVIGRAEVTKMDSGGLGEMCLVHANKNHTEVSGAAGEGAHERLFAYIQRIYGPHIATPQKKATVIYMRRLE
ncbi:hypothetical protein [Cupriavidus campinensis]|uniref:Uncharacterized protein n=1 Tax=Cupriavidus campinensis TaxID=151783 RepID=A0ABY3ESX2_9BURK|nr:hypothetical protein [Cupriavidus campinensis]TSP14000.1 hypothetical protein FGG12_05885 [Cupriavidus campinensis]